MAGIILSSETTATLQELQQVKGFLDFEIVIHNLTYIIEQQNRILQGIEYYNREIMQQRWSYKPNAYFQNAKDWSDGTMRDNWGVSFHITENKRTDGSVDIQKFCDEIQLLATILCKKYNDAKSTQQVTIYLGDFAFNEKTGCLQLRCGKALETDYTAAPSLERLAHEFTKSLHEKNPTEELVLAHFDRYWTPYLQSFSKAEILDYIEAVCALNFSEIDQSKIIPILNEPKEASLSWNEIVKNPHAKTQSGQYYCFYFAQDTQAKAVHNWLREQDALRVMGIMRSTIYHDKGQHTLLVSTQQYDYLNQQNRLSHDQHNAAAVTDRVNNNKCTIF